MSSLRMILISEDSKVFKIPIPKEMVYKPVKQLSNQRVLQVTFYYETYDRKPSQLLKIYFDRIDLDDKGQYSYTDDERLRHFRNISIFTLQTPETYSDSTQEVTIPTASEVPTLKEKEAIINYFKDKMPQFYPQGCYILEKAIHESLERNEANKNFMKEVARLRKNKIIKLK